MASPRILYNQILAKFPQNHLRLAFAYGSGVFQQTGHADMSKNMIDFIFAVDDPQAWHKENMEKNSSHYSFLQYFGPSQITKIQEKLGAAIYFNTLVPCCDRIIKYGVISTESLTNDLLDWETLYVSGRLHKPVYTVKQSEGSQLEIALQSNLQSAVHTSLLILPDEFTESELYTTITSLSYSGDFRMKIGEDKNKVNNIVGPNMDRFRKLYETILDNEDHVHFNKSQGILSQSLSPATRFHHLSLLPKQLILGMVCKRNSDGKNRDTEEVIRSMGYDSDCGLYVSEAVDRIVARSSLTQSIKGVVTAGIVKSTKYSYAKLTKMWKSQSKK